MKKSLRGSLLLLLAALIWGMAFVSQTKGMESMGPLTFNGVRTLIGAVSVFPIAALRFAKRTKAQSNGTGTRIDFKITVIGGVVCGIFLTIASNLQQVGLQYTTVGKAGFITTLYIIFVPIFGFLIFRKKPSFIVWVGAVLATVGLYLLCMTDKSFSISGGDLIVFGCAVVFAFQILSVDYFGERTEGVFLSVLQLFTCGTITTVLALILEHPTPAQIGEGIISILYAGVLSSGVAYTLQIVGQKDLNPTVASLIMSLESVIATVSGYAAYRIGLLKSDQSMTVRQVIGCVVVFAAVILVQLPIGSKKERSKAE